MRLIAGVLLLWLIVGPLTVCAHAVHGRIESTAVGVQFLYDNGSPMTDAEAVVRAPGDEAPFWVIATDPNGRIAFVPDRAGKWVVTADDGLGHAISQHIEIDEAGVAHDHHHVGSRLNGIMAGVGVIFGLFGMAAWWSSRRRLSRDAS